MSGHGKSKTFATSCEWTLFLGRVVSCPHSTRCSEHPDIELTHNEVQEIDKRFAEEWHKFVRDMPAEWKEDKFFLHHKPIIMSQRYGQNTPIAVAGNIVSEATQWQEERSWSGMKYVSMALATEIM